MNELLKKLDKESELAAQRLLDVLGLNTPEGYTASGVMREATRAVGVGPSPATGIPGSIDGEDMLDRYDEVVEELRRLCQSRQR